MIIYDVERTKWQLNSGEKEAETGKVRDRQVQLRFLAPPNKAEGKNLTLTSTIHAEVSLAFHHQNTRKTIEHTRDAKNMNLDDSQPEGKVRNLALIFLCENFHAASTIPLKVRPH